LRVFLGGGARGAWGWPRRFVFSIFVRYNIMNA